MLPEVIIENKPVIASGSFFLHSTELSATILLEDASFIIHVFDPSEGQTRPEFNVDSNTGAHAFMPGSFVLTQFGPGAKYSIRARVDRAFEGGNGLYLVFYSVHEV